MWLIDIIPHGIFYIAVLIAVIGIAISSTPLVGRFITPVLVVSIAVAIISSFLSGVVYDEDRWKLKLADMEQRALKAEADAATANGRVIIEYVDKVRTVTKVQTVIEKVIVDKAPIINESCKVTPEMVDILNQSAQARKGTK